MGPIIPFGKIIFALNVYLKVKCVSKSKIFCPKKEAKKFFPFVPQLPHINFVTQLCHSFNF